MDCWGCILNTPDVGQCYEDFLKGLDSRNARINYDRRFDTLYIFSTVSWVAELHESPQSFKVFNGTMVDILRSTDTVYGIGVQGFDRYVRHNASGDLVAWWDAVMQNDPQTVDGHRLVEALQSVSFV